MNEKHDYETKINNNKKDKEKEKREGMCNAVLGFEVHVTKIQEGKTICPYLAITKETSVFQGYWGEKNKQRKNRLEECRQENY